MRRPTIDEEFINKYSKLITDNVCVFAHIDKTDKYSRAIYAYNQLNPNDPISEESYNIGDEKEFYVCEDGLVYDTLRSTLIMDVISALLHPEEFREILFNRPTNKYRKRPDLVHHGSLMYGENFLSLRHLYEEMLYATNTLVDSVTLQRWKPLIRAFTTYSYVGLNLTTTDIYGHTYQLVPAEKSTVPEVELITDGAVLFSSGEAHITDMSKITGPMRYQSPHKYEKKTSKDKDLRG